MKSRFLFFLLSALVTTLSGCDKDDSGSTPSSAVGTVKGSVQQAYAVEEIYLVSGTDTLKTLPVTSGPNTYTGTYEFGQVKPGNYKVGVNSIYSFSAPAPVPVTVRTGDTIVVPKFELYTANNGLMTFTFNDTVQTGSPNLGIGPTTMSVSFPTTQYTFSIDFPVITGTGLYSTATHNTMQVRFFNWKQESWYADKNQGTATMQVTAFNPVSGIGNATFSFTAVSPGKPNVVVTKGTLYSVRLRP